MSVQVRNLFFSTRLPKGMEADCACRAGATVSGTILIGVAASMLFAGHTFLTEYQAGCLATFAITFVLLVRRQRGSSAILCSLFTLLLFGTLHRLYATGDLRELKTLILLWPFLLLYSMGGTPNRSRR